MGKYVITVSPKGKYHFNLLAGNGEIVLSSQMYASQRGALKGINSVTVNAPEAGICDLTSEKVTPVSNPKFEIFEGKDKKFYFRLVVEAAAADRLDCRERVVDGAEAAVRDEDDGPALPGGEVDS